MSTDETFRCPACESPATVAFHHEESVPTNSCLLLSDRAEAARYPRGTLDLRICEGCGFISNASFDPARAG
jgi:hypothetical protein